MQEDLLRAYKIVIADLTSQAEQARKSRMTAVGNTATALRQRQQRLEESIALLTQEAGTIR